MKAAWLVPLTLCGLACGGGAAGPRGFENQAGAAGSTSAGGSAVGAAGAAAGGAPSAGAAGVVGMGGSAAGSGGVLGGGGTGPLAHPDLRTVVYLPSWRGSAAAWATKLDFSELTYLNLCFADVDAAGNVTFSDAALDTLVLAAHAHGVKVCMAIGGATVIDTGGVYASVLQDGLRDTLVGKLGQFAADHQLDCIDVDLEGNGVNQYYEAFVTSLASKLHAENKELTCAVSSWFGEKITVNAIAAFDFMNIMAYDLHNPGGSAQPVQSSSLEEATKEVDYWVGRGLPKNKAVFGVPFYGYKWAAGKSEALTYAQILAQDPQAATQDQLTLGGAPVYLNSRATIQAKTKLATTYGGIMAWELGQDAAGDGSLLRAIADATP
jgi:chitinase